MIQSQRGIDTLLIAPVSGTDAATVSWDCKGASYATIRIGQSAELTTNAEVNTVSLLHCDTTVVTDHVTMVADQSFATIGAAAELRYEIDLRGKKRYLRLTMTPGTVATDDAYIVSAIGTLTRNIADPASTTAMGDDTVVIV